jgi:hypothetical protein
VQSDSVSVRPTAARHVKLYTDTDRTTAARHVKLRTDTDPIQNPGDGCRCCGSLANSASVDDAAAACNIHTVLLHFICCMCLEFTNLTQCNRWR